MGSCSQEASLGRPKSPKPAVYESIAALGLSPSRALSINSSEPCHPSQSAFTPRPFCTITVNFGNTQNLDKSVAPDRIPIAPRMRPTHENLHPTEPDTDTEKCEFLAATYSRGIYKTTTIGNAAFHVRVRNGNGWYHCFLATRKNRSATRPISSIVVLRPDDPKNSFSEIYT